MRCGGAGGGEGLAHISLPASEPSVVPRVNSIYSPVLPMIFHRAWMHHIASTAACPIHTALSHVIFKIVNVRQEAGASVIAYASRVLQDHEECPHPPKKYISGAKSHTCPFPGGGNTLCHQQRCTRHAPAPRFAQVHIYTQTPCSTLASPDGMVVCKTRSTMYYGCCAVGRTLSRDPNRSTTHFRPSAGDHNFIFSNAHDSAAARIARVGDFSCSGNGSCALSSSDGGCSSNTNRGDRYVSLLYQIANGFGCGREVTTTTS